MTNECECPYDKYPSLFVPNQPLLKVIKSVLYKEVRHNSQGLIDKLDNLPCVLISVYC